MGPFNVVTLFTLGDYTRYKAVFYRVYHPGSDSQSRGTTIIATSLGPLAITAANLINIHNNKCGFHLIAYVPVTLATAINNECDMRGIGDLCPLPTPVPSLGHGFLYAASPILVSRAK